MHISDRIHIISRLVFQTGQPKIFSFHDCLPDVFSGCIELLLTKRFRILGAEELLERRGPGAAPQRSRGKRRKEAFLTFDDGRRNCWTVVFPLLKKYKIRASMFIIPSRVKETETCYPNLEDYWKSKVSWENLYLSHRKEPYLTWRELQIMQESGLVSVFSHGLRHEVASVSSHVIDFQHPGVYEMPVYFDEWFQRGSPSCDSLWGAPIYERAWAALASNEYLPDTKTEVFLNEFVKKNGDFLFFKKKGWRQKLFEYFRAHKRSFDEGHFRKLENKEDARSSVFDSKKIIESHLNNDCVFFSLPLYQGTPEIMELAQDAGYKAVFAGFAPYPNKSTKLLLFNRIPGFWLKFLNYL